MANRFIMKRCLMPLSMALLAVLCIAMPVLGAVSNALTYTTYRVVSGDNLWNLARRYKTTTSAIASASGIDADATLKIGQSLRIPITASTTPVQPAAAAPAPAPAQPLPERTDGTAAVAVPWSVVNKLWPDRADAQITDVKTGMKFTVARRAGWAHADIEPKTRADTAIMKKIFLGKWTWDRRAVVFEYDGRRIAASLAGYPHGGEYIVDNGVLGVFDLHFLGSTTHGSAWTVNRKPTVDPVHQAMVQAAVGH